MSNNIDNILKLGKATDLNTRLIIYLGYTSRSFEERVTLILKEHDLSLPQYNVLRILRGQKGKPASLACVQERMVDKNSNTTRLVDKLIKKDLTRRRICPSNRRKVEIEITQNGLELLKTLDPLTKEMNANSLNELTEKEKLTLHTLLNKLHPYE